MISIGNDIVAVSTINRQRTTDSRFHAKFITQAELALYQGATVSALPFESFVWLLWSIKESVYKYQKRLNPELLFAPVKIIVQDIAFPDGPDKVTVGNIWESEAFADGFITGTVVSRNQTLHFRSVVQHNMVATIVNGDSSFLSLYWGIQQIDNSDQQTQSRLVREFVLNRVKSIFPQQNLTIQKNVAGYPMLLSNNIDTAIPVSFAHHGKYISYCFKY